MLTITPWDPVYIEGENKMSHKHSEIFVSLFINTKKCVVNSRFEKFGSSNRIQVKVQKQHQGTTTKTQAIIKKATKENMVLKMKEDNVAMANSIFSEFINRLAAVALQIHL